MPITFNSFLGANKSIEPVLLDATVGVESKNQRPGKGDLRPFKQPLPVATVQPNRTTIYRMGADVASESAYWLAWPGIVNVVRSMDGDDTTERTYYTGDGTPKWTNNAIGLQGSVLPSASRELGVPAPTTGLTAAVLVAASGNLPEEQYYWLQTFVNDIGWESAPSPISNAQLQQPGTTFTLSGLAPPPSGSYGINRRRIYKTITGDSGNAEYFFLMEIAATLTEVVDDARSTGSDTLPTLGWLPPPADGHGFKAMWNGMAAMLSGKSVRPCEPYEQYAYPLAYSLDLMHVGIALGVWKQSMVVLTTGDVYGVSGADPSSLDCQPLNFQQPCASPRSVVDFENGVAWASPAGLCWIGDDGHRMLTAGLIDPLPSDDNPSGLAWSMMHPETMIASRYGGLLVLFYNDGLQMRGIVMDPSAPSLYFLDKGYDAVFRDPVSLNLYVYESATGQISRFDAGQLMTATWRSKELMQPEPMTFGACEVIARGYPVQVTWWVDGVKRYERSVTSKDPFTLPDGFVGERLQCEVSTAVGSVQAVRLGVDMKDLAKS